MQKGMADHVTDHFQFTDEKIDSTFPCFTAFGDQTAHLVRERFQPALTRSLIGEHVDRLIDTSLGSHWTRLYDSVSRFHS